MIPMKVSDEKQDVINSLFILDYDPPLLKNDPSDLKKQFEVINSFEDLKQIALKFKIYRKR